MKERKRETKTFNRLQKQKLILKERKQLSDYTKVRFIGFMLCTHGDYMSFVLDLFEQCAEKQYLTTRVNRKNSYQMCIDQNSLGLDQHSLSTINN